MADTGTPNRLTERSVRSIHKSLKEFGYTNLTVAEVQEAGDYLLAGGDPKRDIITMFMDGMLRDAGVLPDVE